MRIFAILTLAVLCASLFSSSYSSAMASIVSFDKERVAYTKQVDNFYSKLNSVKNPDISSSENHYYFYRTDSNYRFSTETLSGDVRYEDSVSDNGVKIIPQNTWESAITGSRQFVTNTIVANPNMAYDRGEMLYSSRDYVSSAAQAMLDSIIFAREGLASMPNTSDKMALDSDLAKDQELFKSRIPLIKNCTDPVSMIYYAAMMDNSIESSKPRVRKALAAYSRYEASNLKRMMEKNSMGRYENIPDFSNSFSDFNDYNTLSVVKEAMDKSGY